MCRDDSYSTIVYKLFKCRSPATEREKSQLQDGPSPTWTHRAVSMSIDRIFGELLILGWEISKNHWFFSLSDLSEHVIGISPYFSHQKTRVFLAISNSSQGFPTFFSHHWPATFATGVPRCGARVCAAERWAAPSTPWFPAESLGFPVW